MNRKIIITYRWWRDNKRPIKQAHVEALEETAEQRIGEMMKQGFTSGNLSDNIHMGRTDPEDGIPYSGWWEVKKT